MTKTERKPGRQRKRSGPSPLAKVGLVMDRWVQGCGALGVQPPLYVVEEFVRIVGDLQTKGDAKTIVGDCAEAARQCGLVVSEEGGGYRISAR